jgi:hypothetical protein
VYGFFGGIMATLLEIIETTPDQEAGSVFNSTGSFLWRGDVYTDLSIDLAQTFTVPTGKIWTLESFGVYVNAFIPNAPTWSVKISLCNTTGGLPNLSSVLSEVVCTQASHPAINSYWTTSSGMTLTEGVYAIVMWGATPIIDSAEYDYAVNMGGKFDTVEVYSGGDLFERANGGSWLSISTYSGLYADAAAIVTGVESAAVPGKAENPTPADDALAQSLQLATLSWDEGSPVADTMNVYFGLAGSMVLLSWAQAGTACSVPYTLAWATEYEWRVDTTNAEGTTTGDTWSFTTIGLLPPVDRVTYKRLVAAANNKIWYENI